VAHARAPVDGGYEDQTGGYACVFEDGLGLDGLMHLPVKTVQKEYADGNPERRPWQRPEELAAGLVCPMLAVDVCMISWVANLEGVSGWMRMA